MRIACFTGHRPDKIGGYNEDNPIAGYIKEMLFIEIISAIDNGYTRFIHGGALGVDTWAAEIVHNIRDSMKYSIESCLYRPFLGQEKMWNDESKKRYFNIYDKADTVLTICEGEYAAWKMLARDRAMVDASELVIATWNGDLGKSGTGHTVSYARKKQKDMIIIDPRDYNGGIV